MKASVVVPSYQMAAHLDWTLAFLEAQELRPGDALEVVVVDDGSTDETQRVMACHADKLDLHGLFRARDDRSSRSLARNVGIGRATGELLVLLDSGVIVEPTFVQSTLDHHRRGPGTVLLHQTLGLYAATFDFDRTSLTPANLRERFAGRVDDEAWRDIRDPLFASVDWDLDRLLAPWAAGWTCALSVSRKLVAAIDGFDESFTGWGAEDLDFCYRLERAGARFAATHDALCVHIPHTGAGEPAPAREAQHRANRLKIHRRDHALETELCVFLGAMGCNIFGGRLEHLAAMRLLPVYGSELVDLVLRYVAGDLLVVGPVGAETLTSLRASSVFVQTHTDLAALRAHLPNLDAVRSFCCATSRADADFGTVLLTDALRLYPGELQVAQIREAARIGRQVLLACTETRPEDARRARYRALDGWVWTPEGELLSVARAAGCDPIELSRSPSTVLYRLHREPGR